LEFADLTQLPPHVTASTWKNVWDRFTAKKILQLTATPFRRDEQKVDGKIIFNFKLGDAQEAGYYCSINLRTVEEFGDQEARDLKIATEAVAVLRSDRNDHTRDHLLMARTRPPSCFNRAIAAVTASAGGGK
jgi:hypothetical protein